MFRSKLSKLSDEVAKQTERTGERHLLVFSTTTTLRTWLESEQISDTGYQIHIARSFSSIWIIALLINSLTTSFIGSISSQWAPTSTSLKQNVCLLTENPAFLAFSLQIHIQTRLDDKVYRIAHDSFLRRICSHCFIHRALLLKVTYYIFSVSFIHLFYWPTPSPPVCPPTLPSYRANDLLTSLKQKSN